MDWIVNASPLILLARVGALPLLSQLADVVEVPHAVVREVTAAPESLALEASLLRGQGFRITPDAQVATEIAGWDLGDGESQVLAAALRRTGCEVVLDDLQARRCARLLGIPTVGTLGVLLQARKLGLIPAARPLVERLLLSGMYLSYELAQSALAEVGE